MAAAILIVKRGSYAELFELNQQLKKRRRIQKDSQFGRDLKRHAFYRPQDVEGLGHSLISDDLTQIHIGLVDRVRWLAHQYGLRTVVRDKGPDYVSDDPLFDGYRATDFRTINIKQEPWQIQKRLIDALLRNNVCMVQAAPGSGKTNIMAQVMAKEGIPAMMVVPDLNTLTQARDRLKELLPADVSVGVVGGGEVSIGFFTILTRQSLSSALHIEKDGRKRDVPIERVAEIADAWRAVRSVWFDESHHTASVENLRILHEAKGAWKRRGVSATARREDGREILIEAVLGPVVAEITYGDMIDDGKLVPVTFYAVKMPQRKYHKHAVVKDRARAVKNFLTFDDLDIAMDKSFSGRSGDWGSGDSYHEVYDDYIINNPIRNMLAVEFADRMVKNGRSVAIIVKEIRHGLLLARMIPNSEFIWAGYPKAPLPNKNSRRDTGHPAFEGVRAARYGTRKDAWDALRKKELMVVISTLMNEALDIPSLSAVALMPGGKSVTQFIQRLRNLRTFRGETESGEFVKHRGFVFYPIDKANWLQRHSSMCMKIIREIEEEHSKNRVKVSDWLSWLPGDILGIFESTGSLKKTGAAILERYGIHYNER